MLLQYNFKQTPIKILRSMFSLRLPSSKLHLIQMWTSLQIENFKTKITKNADWNITFI